MAPAVGTDVLYKLTAGDAHQVNERRADAGRARTSIPVVAASNAPHERGGYVVHEGNHVTVGEVFPATVVRAFDGLPRINLQVTLDGSDHLWVTSSQEGDEPGQWSWPLSEMAVAVSSSVEHTAPQVGDIVHYVSYGTPGGEYGKECRAAIVTELTQAEVNEQNPAGDGIYRQTVGLMVANPTGQFFNRGVLFDDGAETPGDPECLSRVNHGNPFRYCECGWMESAFKGGTWHPKDHA